MYRLNGHVRVLCRAARFLWAARFVFVDYCFFWLWLFSVVLFPLLDDRLNLFFPEVRTSK